MIRVSKIFALALAVTTAASASAATYVFRAEGTVLSAYSADRNFNSVPNPPSSISIGDSFSVEFRLNTVGAIPEPLYDADPNTNIYRYHVTDFKMGVGPSYLTLPSPNEETFGSFQLWNNRPSAGAHTDALTLAVLRYLPVGASPVMLGNGPINVQFHYDAFDFTGEARQSDLLSEQPPLNRYSSRGGFIGFLNSDTYLQTGYRLAFESASLTALPDPATWTMMIAGLGLVGASLRRRASAACFVRLDVELETSFAQQIRG